MSDSGPPLLPRRTFLAAALGAAVALEPGVAVATSAAETEATDPEEP